MLWREIMPSGVVVLRTAGRYISSDLLRDHPVGNMMRSVLQLHDLSKMDVTLFIIHDHQKYAVSYPENRHVIGDVKIKIIGRSDPLAFDLDLSRCSGLRACVTDRTCLSTLMVLTSKCLGQRSECDQTLGRPRVSAGHFRHLLTVCAYDASI